MSQGRWPDGKAAAISITLDNMGEAAELQRGAWPDDATIGLHHSVTESLPRILRILGDCDIRATYFVEGWNAGIYGGAIQAVRHAGHEIGFHGWRHEPWSTLDEATERELIERSLNGFYKLNLTIQGFRPPGGILTDSTVSLLAERGFAYCSPAGADAAIDDSIVYLPFEWQGIDAYYYSEGFGGLRTAKGDQERPLNPDELVDRVESLIDQRIETGGYTALLFHPFLEVDEQRIDAMCRILTRVSEDDRIWCAPAREIASWITAHRSNFEADPKLDTTSWSR